MNNRNSYKPGYKETNVGWIPESWDYLKLSDIAYVQTGLAKNKKTSKMSVLLPYLRVANVQDGFLNLKEVKEIQIESSICNRYVLQYEDVLFTEGGDCDKLGRGTLWRNEIDNCLHQNHIFAARCNKERILPYYLASLAAGSLGRQYFLLSSKQSTNLASINSSQLKAFPVPLPSLTEQKKIVEILQIWDRAIEQTCRLIKAKKKRRKGLMQQFFLEKNNLISKDLAPSWKRIRARDLFRNTSKRNYGHLPVLSVTQNNGVILRKSRERKINSKKSDLNLYKLVEPGDFVISLRSFQGGLELSKIQGVVSPAYHVIHPIKEISVEFYKYYFKSYDFIGHLAIAVIGIRDGKQVSYDDFSFLKLPYPSIDEQRAIAVVLQTADQEINQLETKLQALEKQKRGLMQKLLTGEIRV